MGHMIDGQWQPGYFHEKASSDEFERAPTTYRDFVRADGSTGFAPEAGRYHLYVAWACPWANRTLIMRRLKGLTEAISVSVVAPHMGEDGWVFDDSHPDELLGKSYLREVYAESDSRYTGRVTVPVLWDKKSRRIVNNESREIIRMLDHEFGDFASNETDYAPAELRDTIEDTLDAIYEPINNGVYRSGFARSQAAYDKAVSQVFEALDHWDGVLSERRYLCGDQLTEADICMFTTLVRFDAVYHTHFKCNIRRIFDYPNLAPYLRDLYQTPGFGETVHLDEIKEHYYWSHTSINPTQIVPKGPALDFSAPHGRERFSRN